MNKKYGVDDTFFEEINTEEKAYFLGLLFADGSVSNKKSRYVISLSLKDRELVELFGKTLKSGAEVKTYLTESSTMHTIVVCNKRLVTQLVGYGCESPKARNIRLPKLTYEMTRHFIRGYFDGDGSLSFNKSGNPTFNIASNINFIIDLARWVEENLGISPYVNPGPVGKTCLLNIRNWDEAVRITDWLYTRSTVYLKRKEALYQDLKKRYKNYLSYREDCRGIRYSRQFLVNLYHNCGTWKKVAEVLGYHPDHLKVYRRTLGLTNYKADK